MLDTTNVLTPEYPILPVMAARRSPRAYTSQPVPAEALNQLFVAAGSAASCFGEQPWRFLVGNKATHPEAFDKILGTMGEFNQVWAKNAPVLVASIAKKTFSHDSNPNRYALHDVGQASATLALQATELGMQIHQMAGFSQDALRAAFNIPADYDIVAVFTIGYPGDLEALPDALRERELAPRTRKPLTEFVFEGGWPQLSTERYDQASV
jgi:nitroreductase